MHESQSPLAVVAYRLLWSSKAPPRLVCFMHVPLLPGSPSLTSAQHKAYMSQLLTDCR